MNFNYIQKSKQSQVQTLAPALIKSMQLLSLPYLSLKSFLERTVLENPFLELEMLDEHTIISIEDIKGPIGEARTSKTSWENLLHCHDDTDSLSEALQIQLLCSNANQQLMKAGQAIIRFIDERGYLSQPLSEIANESHIPLPLAKEALHLIQSFYPKGVGASNLKECLLLQIDPGKFDPAVIQKLFSAPDTFIMKRDLKYLAKFCGLSTKKVNEIFRYLKTLSPYPGDIFSSPEPISFIYPEIEIYPQDGRLQCTIHNITDIVKIDTNYFQQLSSDPSADSDTLEYIQAKYREAAELMSSLNLRFHAIEKLTVYLMDTQRDYFMSPFGKLKALTIRQAAEAVGMNSSTVSRCVNGRYIRTVHGIMPLKNIFSIGLPASGNTAISSVEIKKMIQDIIRREAPGNPVTDQQLAEQLNSQGIVISRRTVAKYRSLMGIEGSKHRKGENRK